MQKNWMPIVLLVLSAEIAALLVLITVWLPGRLDRPEATGTEMGASAETRLVEIENKIGQLEMRVREMAKKSNDLGPLAKEIAKIKSAVEDIGTQVYEHDQDNTRNLMRMQANIMRRLSVLGGAAGPPEEPGRFQEWLQEGGVTLDVEAEELRFGASIASPNRPLETVVATEGGPLHEALFEGACRPWALRAALEKLGLRPGKPADYARGIEATGDRVAVTVSWPGLAEPVPLESLILDLHADGAMSKAEWIFTGSSFEVSFATGENVYVPDESRVLISLTHNFGHLSVVSCRHPDAGNEMNWQVNLDALPESHDAPITIHMSRAKGS